MAWLSLGLACVVSAPDDDPTDAVAGACGIGCADNDAREPNQSHTSAAALVWDDVSAFGGYLSIDAFLCPGESDWYRVPVSELKFDFYGLHVDAIAAGSSWCASVEVCGEPALPEAPEHTMRVEVFDATSLLLVAEGVGLDGRVDVNGFDESFANDLLLRVSGPTPLATYAYELHVEIRSFGGEDECEC
ncbi:hypothetical protein DB30_00023 [Enhygromyxa salina]|uniref:Uncharacterized protein n=1 Tax=Enhygromyxa salina TaxID=215803 RepID=A0A0C1ZPE1_9BACT|nr:hypothetical protein DB30_00023 [Enhygromyxa salina]